MRRCLGRSGREQRRAGAPKGGGWHAGGVVVIRKQCMGGTKVAHGWYGSVVLTVLHVLPELMGASSDRDKIDRCQP